MSDVESAREPALEPEESNRVLRYLFNDLAGQLDRSEARQDESVVAAVAALKDLKPNAGMQAPRLIPVTADLDTAITTAERQRAWRLAPNMRGLRRALRWVQNANYSGQAGFLRNYGFSLVVGPGGLMESDALSLGFLLLTPGFHYPAHAHPAVEIYVPLTGPAQWYRDGEGWVERAPPDVIVHSSGQVHAMQAGETPLLAIWLWLGDLATQARLVDGHPAPEPPTV